MCFIKIIKFDQALNANFLKGKFYFRLRTLRGYALAWCLVSLYLMALVFLALKSRGSFFLFSYDFLQADLTFSLITVRYLAICFLTNYQINKFKGLRDLFNSVIVIIFV